MTAFAEKIGSAIVNGVDWQRVLTCLGIMGKGMAGIFTVILAIWGCVALLNYLTKPKTKA